VFSRIAYYRQTDLIALKHAVKQENALKQIGKGKN
jgi:hypothetical protein